MKEKFLDYCLNGIKKSNSTISKVKLEELRYGLEGIYLTITKSIVIFGLALILGIFNEMFLLLIFFNILRSTGFGLHATKSWICLLSSTIIFIFLPYLSKVLVLPIILKILLGIIAIVLIFMYAPSDTIKRPIVSMKRRNLYKLITTINCILLVFVAVLYPNNTISNLILFGIYNEIILIVPLTYKIFNLSYNNYLNYLPD